MREMNEYVVICFTFFQFVSFIYFKAFKTHLKPTCEGYLYLSVAALHDTWKAEAVIKPNTTEGYYRRSRLLQEIQDVENHTKPWFG